MGCTASLVNPEEQEQTKKPLEKNNNTCNQAKQSPNHNISNGHIQPHPPPYKKRELPVPKQAQSFDKNANRLKAMDQTPGKPDQN